MWGAVAGARGRRSSSWRGPSPGADIVSAYGQTEMSGATTLLKGVDATRKMGSVGKPMLGVELRVVERRLEVDPARSARSSTAARS